MPSNNNFNPFKFSLLSSLYISLGAYFVINYNDLSISVESVLISFIIFGLSFFILQLRVRKLFFERIRQIYEDLEFETDSLIKTSPIDSDMNSFSKDLEEFVKSLYDLPSIWYDFQMFSYEFHMSSILIYKLVAWIYWDLY